MIQHVCPVALAPAHRVPSVVWFEAVEVRQGVTLCFATVIRASLSLSLSLCLMLIHSLFAPEEL